MLAKQLWADFLFLHQGDRLSHLSHHGRPRPAMLTIETVNSCNNLCIVCAYKDQQRKKQTMPLEIFEKTLADYRDIGGGIVSLTPIVGDVFMDKLLPERVDRLADRDPGLDFTVTTNAAMAHRFDDQDLERLLRLFGKIQISIYGMDPDEYRIMTKRDTYEKMLEGIRRIASLYKGELFLSFRLLKKKQQPEIARWIYNDLFNVPVGGNLPRTLHINSVIDRYANWGVLDISKPLPFDGTWMQPTRIQAQCAIPLYSWVIFSNGNVSFCPCDNFDDVAEFSLGNVMETSLSEMYRSEKVERLWNWHKYGVPAFCKTCTFHIPLLENSVDYDMTLQNPFMIMGG